MSGRSYAIPALGPVCATLAASGCAGADAVSGSWDLARAFGREVPYAAAGCYSGYFSYCGTYAYTGSLEVFSDLAGRLDWTVVEELLMTWPSYSYGSLVEYDYHITYAYEYTGAERIWMKPRGERTYRMSGDGWGLDCTLSPEEHTLARGEEDTGSMLFVRSE